VHSYQTLNVWTTSKAGCQVLFIVVMSFYYLRGRVDCSFGNKLEDQDARPTLLRSMAAEDSEKCLHSAGPDNASTSLPNTTATPKSRPFVE
jgi:hypothetical protein